MKNSSDNPPESSCIGKQAFSDKPSAQRIINRRRSIRSGAMRALAYRCKHCGQWHIGSSIGLRDIDNRTQKN